MMMMMMMNCFFAEWLTDKSRKVLFPAGAIVRDSRRHEFPTRREQDLNLHELGAIVITFKPRRH